MDWITGIQKALDYIEANLTEEIDLEELGRRSYSSPYHFQRVFSILCGYTLGEYIRLRRLTLAGSELAAGKIKVIEAAMKYGYESPDSFTKAFSKFHGITPSAAREPGATLRSFSPLTVKLSLEGGSTMDYKIIEKPAQRLIGYKRRFEGTPGSNTRWEQEHNFACETRMNQYLLWGMSGDRDTMYVVLKNIGLDGYDFYFAAQVPDWDICKRELGEEAGRFEVIDIPPQTYLVSETERCEWPLDIHNQLRHQMVSQWLPTSGYRLAEASEMAVIHWPFEHQDAAVRNSRYVELWLPIEQAEEK